MHNKSVNIVESVILNYCWNQGDALKHRGGGKRRCSGAF